MRKLLAIVLFLRILSYFSISDDVSAIQIFKVFLRLCTLAAVTVPSLMYSLSRRGGEYRFRNKAVGLLYAMLLMLAVLSLSYTTSFSVSFTQLYMYLESAAFAYFFCKAYGQSGNEDGLAKALFASIAIIALLFLVGAAALPIVFLRPTHAGEVQRLGGYIINPNELGMLLAIGLGMGYLVILKKDGRGGFPRFLSFLAFLLTFVALVMTQSRSSFIGFLLVSFYFLRSLASRRLKLAALVIGPAVMPVIGYKIFLKLGQVDEVMDMTGRIPFWKDLIVMAFSREPILGFGFQRIFYTDTFASVHSYEAEMAHNTFLQIFLGLGMVGGLVALWTLFLAFCAAAVETDKYRKGMVIGMLIPLVINSITEFGIYGMMNFSVTLFQILIFLLILDRRPALPASPAMRMA